MLVELQHALDKSEQERHFYDALCIDYTAAYLCDLMAYLDDHESFVYRHRTLPNRAGMEYFEARAVRLYSDDDIRTPMNAIIGYTDLLEIYGDDVEKREDYLGKIKSSSEYLLSLLNDVLEMARIESGKYIMDETVTDIREFDRSICDVFENQLEQKGIRFVYTMDVRHHMIFCDTVKLKKVLLNVLSNAYKYTMRFVVERAKDGIECISMLENHPAAYYDLILMDIQMPNMNGYRAAAAIREMVDKELADIPIVAMTANAFEEDKKRALEVGMNAHISKPVNIRALEETLGQLLV